MFICNKNAINFTLLHIRYIEVKTAVHLGTATNLVATNKLKIVKNNLKLGSENYGNTGFTINCMK
jgi:hypothetical protein